MAPFAIHNSTISLLLALLLFAFNSSAKVHFPEPINTLDGKINYLLFLQEELPVLFEQGAEYDVDFLTYIEAQNQLISYLRDKPEYNRLAEARPPLTKIEIFLEQKGRSRKAMAIDESHLENAIAQNKKLDLATALKQYKDAKLKGLLTGLLSLYPPELKTKGFGLRSNTERVAFLKSTPLDKDVFRHSFKAERFGLKGNAVDWKSIVDLASQWANSELEIARHLLELCNEADGEACASVFDAEQDLFDEIKPGLVDSSPEALATIQLARQNIAEQFRLKSSSENSESKEILKLVEVPPYVGIFRGLAGADCSTSFSFAYPYMPNERTFFIYNEDGTMIGYLMGTVIGLQSDAGPYLYVHSISGPSVSRDQVHYALKALQASVKSLGVKEVLMPTKGRVHENINYATIQNAFHALRVSGALKTAYIDALPRSHLADFSGAARVNATYDSPTANTDAHRINWNLIPAKIEAKASPIEPSVVKPKKKLSLGEAVLTALDVLTGERLESARDGVRAAIADIHAHAMATSSLTHTFRQDVAAAVLERFELKLKSGGFPQLNMALGNVDQRPLKDYYQSLQTQFAAFGIALDAELIKKRPYLFYEGHLAAPDAMTTKDTELRKRSIDYVMNLIKRWPKPKVALAAIREHTEAFNNSKRFKTFMRNLTNGDAKDYARLLMIHSAGASLEGLDLNELNINAQRKLQEPGLVDTDQIVIQEILQIIKRHPTAATCTSRLSP